MKEKIQRFLDNEDNKATLLLLAEKVAQQDSVSGHYPENIQARLIELGARQKCLEIWSEWITELFQIKKGEWDELYMEAKGQEFNNIHEYE